MIANGGYRLQPHVLEAIRESNADGSLGRTVYQAQPNVLNVYSASGAEWNVVQNGFYQVVHGSMSLRTGSAYASLKPEVSAKSGTAQTFHGTAETITNSLIMYGPSKDAKVAMAVVFPGMGTSSSSSVVASVAKQTYEAFWKDVITTEGFTDSSNDGN